MAAIARKCRILICPSDDGNDVADTNAPDTNSHEKNVATQESSGTAVAIIGWVDETDSAITTVAIGSIPIPSSSSAENNDVATICDQIISPAINRLAKQYPSEHATYQSLRVLGILCKPVKGNNGNDEPENLDESRHLKNDRHQIIMYDRMEAQRWHYQYNKNPHSYQHCPAGSWQRNALRMGEALTVLENLSSTMKNIEHAHHSGDNAGADDNEQSWNEEKSEYCKDDVSNAVIDQSTTQSQTSSFVKDGSISRQSLLLFHWKYRRQVGAGTSTNEIFAQIPLYSMIQYVVHMSTDSMNGGQRNNISRSKQSKGSTTSKYTTSPFLALLLDSFLGLAIGYILLRHPLPIIQRVVSLWKHFHDHYLHEGLRWLESFPAGFKLNVALTHQMGNEVRLAVQCHQQLLSFLFPVDSCIDAAAASAMDTFSTITRTMPISIVRYLGLSTIIFGSQFFFALAFDITRLALIHIHYLSSLFAACQRLELSTLTSLWRLFRGKKRNILRHRSDHLKYDHMQLLLGMILFTICLFMLTTILVYHCFFAIINHVVQLCVCGIWWCGFLVVEGVMQCDGIVMAYRRSQNDTKNSWPGAGMQFMPTDLADAPYYVDHYLQGSINTVASGNAKIPILQETTLGRDSEECTKDLFSHVSIRSKKVSTMKVAFPAKSGHSIIINACISFITSKLGGTATFFKRILFGSPCPVASACLEISRSARCNV